MAISQTVLKTNLESEGQYKHKCRQTYYVHNILYTHNSIPTTLRASNSRSFYCAFFSFQENNTIVISAFYIVTHNWHSFSQFKAFCYINTEFLIAFFVAQILLFGFQQAGYQ